MNGEIITIAQMRAIDAAAALAGASKRTLMENAGRAVAEVIAQRFSARSTIVLCGPGDNGGDGWVAARVLKEMGWPVAVRALAPPAQLGGAAGDAARAWEGETCALGAGDSEAELFVDALFGAGLSRALEGESAALARVLAPARVVAIDVPSGLNGDTGYPIGAVCFRAGLTVTFVRKKPAHVLLPGRALCGNVLVADISVPASVIDAQNIALWENSPERWSDMFPRPTFEAHKHARGHVLVASGGHMRTGAARLAARAALRVGAGLVTVLSQPDALAENAAQLTAIMLREAGSLSAYAEAAQHAQCALVGPAFGLTLEHRACLDAALDASARCALVLDADALTMLAPLNRKLDPRDVLTPHVGEFKRAFPGLLEGAVNRIDAARAAATLAGCVVLLKGPDTIVAAPDGRAVVNTTGTPFLATAGSGDVLAGLITGLIGQGMASFEAAAAGAWLHGRTGEDLGPGLIAEDLTEVLPSILKSLAVMSPRDAWDG